MNFQKNNRASLKLGLGITMLCMLMTVSQVHAQKNETSISSRNGVHNFSSRNGGDKYEVEYKGRIEFSEDDKSIKSISRGGYMRFRINDAGDRREILAEAASGGIEYDYYIGRKRADFDADGEKWLADNLVTIIRATGIGAEARVERYYKNGGVDGVLEEISQVRGDYVSHIYLQELLDQNGISDDEIVKIAAYVPRELSSDYYIAEVFKDNGRVFTQNDKTIEAFLSAMGRMDSDYYISEILTDVLREELSDGALDKVLDNLDNMDSDYYKAQVIKDVFRNDLSNKQMVSLLASIDEINSDYYKSDVLKRACRMVSSSDSDEVKTSFRKATKGIRSDYYYGSVARCID
jgi:hypothetical protein